MMPPKEVVARLVRQLQGNPEEIAGALEAMDRIRSHRKSIEQALLNAERQWELAQEKCKRSLAVLAKECPHYWTVHHQDPSGGSERSTTCELCGGEV